MKERSDPKGAKPRIHAMDVRFHSHDEATEGWSALSPTRFEYGRRYISVLGTSRSTSNAGIRIGNHAFRPVRLRLFANTRGGEAETARQGPRICR
jgi:hypothetical protein